MKQIKVYVYRNKFGVICEHTEKKYRTDFELLGERTINLCNEQEEKPAKEARDRIASVYCHIYSHGFSRLSWSSGAYIYENKSHLECVELREIRSGEIVVSEDELLNVLAINDVSLGNAEDIIKELFNK